MSRLLRHATSSTVKQSLRDFSDDWPHAHPAEAQVAHLDVLAFPTRFILSGRDENFLGEHSSSDRDRAANDIAVESARCGPFPSSPSVPAHLLQVALSWVGAEWRVLPITPGKRKSRYRTGMTPTTDATQVRRWWERWPEASIGVVIDDLNVVVLDIDGKRGEESLAKLQREAGAELPPTYEESTGRREGGRHLFFRLPSECPALVSQFGSQHPWHLDLDVLFRGHVVVAGSRHHSGNLYSTDATTIPSSAELAALPSAIYDLLARRGRVQEEAAERKERPNSEQPKPPETIGVVATAGTGRAVPRRIAQMLDDTSDGRNGRAFQVVVGLLNRGWAEEEIVAVVLSSPLGAKARSVSPSNPSRWVLQKVESAKRYGFEPCFDADGYWQVAHSAGLSSHLLRILDCFIREARLHNGRVSMSYDRIGIGSAMSDPDDHIHTLVKQGWLTIIECPPRGSGLPQTYRLSIPTDPTHKPAISLGLPPSPFLPSLQCSYGGFVRHLPGHDAFRCARGSLRLYYPLLSLLGEEPVALETLAGPLDVTPEKVSRLASRLVDVGIAVLDEHGLRLGPSPQELQVHLNDVAVAVGTHGKRAQALRRYREKVAAWREQRAEFIRQRNEVGSDVWRKEEGKLLRSHFEQPVCETLVHSWTEEGKTIDDLVTYVVDAQARRRYWQGPRIT